jgi:hypothetical protein
VGNNKGVESVVSGHLGLLLLLAATEVGRRLATEKGTKLAKSDLRESREKDCFSF